jgi:hypothetical protein
MRRGSPALKARTTAMSSFKFMRRDSPGMSWSGPRPGSIASAVTGRLRFPGTRWPVWSPPQLWSYGAVGGTAGVRPHGLDSRRHPRGIHSRRGTQPRAAAGRRRLHGGRRRRDDGPDRVARSVRARPPSGRPERPRARRGRRSRLDGNPARTRAGAHVIGTGRAAGRPHSTSARTSSSTSTTTPWKTSAESTWLST